MESFVGEGQDAQSPELNPKAYQSQASYVIRREQTTSTCATPVLSPLVSLRWPVCSDGACRGL